MHTPIKASNFSSPLMPQASHGDEIPCARLIAWSVVAALACLAANWLALL